MEEERKAGAGRCSRILPSLARDQAPRGHPPVSPVPAARPALRYGSGAPAGASASLRQQDQLLKVGLRFCPGFSPRSLFDIFFFPLREVLVFRFEPFALPFLLMHL